LQNNPLLLVSEPNLPIFGLPKLTGMFVVIQKRFNLTENCNLRQRDAYLQFVMLYSAI